MRKKIVAILFFTFTTLACCYAEGAFEKLFSIEKCPADFQIEKKIISKARVNLSIKKKEGIASFELLAEPPQQDIREVLDKQAIEAFMVSQVEQSITPERIGAKSIAFGGARTEEGTKLGTVVSIPLSAVLEIEKEEVCLQGEARFFFSDKALGSVLIKSAKEEDLAILQGIADALQ